MQITRRTLFANSMLRVDEVRAQPSIDRSKELEQQDSNVLVLPLAGVFAKHDSSRHHVIATSNHGVLIAAGIPYRTTLPGDVGDRCLALRFSSASLANVMPESILRDSFDASKFTLHTLLPSQAMMTRQLLWRRLEEHSCEALDIEALSCDLLATVLDASRLHPSRSSPRRHNSGLRKIERVKELIATQPTRKWTLTDLARHASSSPYHLARIFRKEIGTSIHDYVLRARLANALDAVLDAHDLATIALENGFTNHSHFTARFHAFFGITPSALRRRTTSGTAAQMRKIVTARTASAH